MINPDLRAMTYESRLVDVVAEAHREGSLDSAIRNRNENDLLGLLDRFPNIKAIAFNGGTAGRLGIQVLGPRAVEYQILILPSSSPAYTVPFADKAKLWLALQSVVKMAMPQSQSAGGQERTRM